jgi:hypothetical protein
MVCATNAVVKKLHAPHDLRNEVSFLDAKSRIADRIAICWIQAQGLSQALSERINQERMRDFYMFSDDRLLELENQAQGLADAIKEIRTLRRYDE